MPREIRMTTLAHHAAAAASSPPAATHACNAQAPDPPARRMAAGPGWYESSWELLRGLEVCEGPAPDDGAADTGVLGTR
jgi:hypothetical protein